MIYIHGCRSSREKRYLHESRFPCKTFIYTAAVPPVRNVYNIYTAVVSKAKTINAHIACLLETKLNVNIWKSCLKCTTVVQVELVFYTRSVNVDKIQPKMCTGSHTILYQTNLAKHEKTNMTKNQMTSSP